MCLILPPLRVRPRDSPSEGTGTSVDSERVGTTGGDRRRRKESSHSALVCRGPSYPWEAESAVLVLKSRGGVRE